jgi:hypothetical protein
LAGGEVGHEGAIFIDGRVDACLEGVMRGHDRNIVHEYTMNDFIGPWPLLRLG